jgi:hypothetical protein
VAENGANAGKTEPNRAKSIKNRALWRRFSGGVREGKGVASGIARGMLPPYIGGFQSTRDVRKSWPLSAPMGVSNRGLSSKMVTLSVKVVTSFDAILQSDFHARVISNHIAC